MESVKLPKSQIWELPPIILHPFSDPAGPDKLVESSRAHLMMQGLLPAGELKQEEILHRLLSGRLCELRMLYYVGKDLERWVEECSEIAERDETLRLAGVKAASFVHLLVETPPDAVRAKLAQWGVVDHKSVFSRALGLKAVFARVPDIDTLSPNFIRYYYRYADQMYVCRQGTDSFTEIPLENVHVDLYASGEYSRMLEREWEEI